MLVQSFYKMLCVIWVFLIRFLTLYGFNNYSINSMYTSCFPWTYIYIIRYWNLPGFRQIYPESRPHSGWSFTRLSQPYLHNLSPDFCFEHVNCSRKRPCDLTCGECGLARCECGLPDCLSTADPRWTGQCYPNQSASVLLMLMCYC